MKLTIFKLTLALYVVTTLGVNPLNLQGQATTLPLADNTQTLPSGLFRLHVNGTTFNVEGNSAVAGDFSTINTFMKANASANSVGFPLGLVGIGTTPTSGASLQVTGGIQVKGVAGGNFSSVGPGIDLSYDSTANLGILQSFQHSGILTEPLNIIGQSISLVTGSSGTTVMVSIASSNTITFGPVGAGQWTLNAGTLAPVAGGSLGTSTLPITSASFSTTIAVAAASALNQGGQSGILYTGYSQLGGENIWINDAAALSSVPVIVGSRSRGSFSSRSDIANNDKALVLRARMYSNGAFKDTAEIRFVDDGTFTTGNMPPSREEFWTTPNNGLQTEALVITSGQAVLAMSMTGGMGYTTGAGGTVTQITSKSTGVTLNKVTGQITMQAAALASAAKATFTVTDSAVAATDTIIVSIASGGTANAYRAEITSVGSGSFGITVENITGGSLSEAPVITFAVFHAATS